MISRQSWDEYFMTIVESVSSRATCDRGKAGCVVVTPDHRIACTGYVGSPPGLPHCDDEGHRFAHIQHPNGELKAHCVRTIHAEQNAICQAA